MSRGLSLHIGLNSVDPGHYSGWEGRLRGCESDANSMQLVADTQQFSSTLLLTRDATADRVKAAIEDAAKRLLSGDTFFLSYSGHGGQVPDTNGGDEDDGLDETWVLYDRMLIDDELYSLWSQFRPGVRIVVLSDSCHSGTVLRAVLDVENVTHLYRRLIAARVPAVEETGFESETFKAMPTGVQEQTYRSHQDFYDEIQRRAPTGDRANIGASVLLISGCQDNQLSADGLKNGLFTATLIRVWNEGNFIGNYRQFHQAIKRQMPTVQTPNLMTVGVESPAFVGSKPFSFSADIPASGHQEKIEAVSSGGVTSSVSIAITVS